MSQKWYRERAGRLGTASPRAKGKCGVCGQAVFFLKRGGRHLAVGYSKKYSFLCLL